MAWTKQQRREYQHEWYLRHREQLLEAQRANRARRADDDTWRRHGLRPGTIAAMYQAQDGRCYLCGDGLQPDVPHAVNIDHDHAHCPGRRSCVSCQRGLACHNCNLAIGLVFDDPDRLRRMADALEAAQLAVAKRVTAAPRQLAFGQETA